MPRMRAVVGLTLLLAASVLLAQNRAAEKKKRTLKDTATAEAWVYDDFDAALEIARQSAKPIFLVFR